MCSVNASVIVNFAAKPHFHFFQYHILTVPIWHSNNEMTSWSDDASQFCRTLSRIWKMFKYSDAHCYIKLTVRERQ